MLKAPTSTGRTSSWALVCRALAVGLVASLALASTARSQDPLAPQQDWLPRVVNAPLAAPAREVPPIAIIEAGFDDAHPEMAGGWVQQRRYGPERDLADEAQLYDLASGIAHGTSVASVIGAPRNGVGIEGVLPGTRVWVYGSSGTCPDTAAAIRQAVEDGARVINASYGFEAGAWCREHQNATSYAFGRDVLVVAAAGNGRPQQPALQPGNDLHVLTVTALNHLDQPTGFSYQNVHADIAAPGEAVLLATPTWWDTDDGLRDGFARSDGTSFAAPMVAAAAARIFAERPELTADQVAEVLRRSARDIGRPGWDISTGWGALDLRAALARPAPIHDAWEPNDDIRWVDGRSGFRPSPPLARTRPVARLTARLDAQKDPWDVYPVWIPTRGEVTITMTPRGMGADLYAWQQSATTAYGSSGRVIGKSRRRGLGRERLVVFTAGAAHKFWLEVRGVRSGSLAGDYTLVVRRTG